MLPLLCCVSILYKINSGKVELENYTVGTGEIRKMIITKFLSNALCTHLGCVVL